MTIVAECWHELRVEQIKGLLWIPDTPGVYVVTWKNGSGYQGGIVRGEELEKIARVLFPD